MYRLRPVANGTRTDYPVPGLPFINDERLPLSNPDAIERTGRNQGKGLWGRTDPTAAGGWVAFTTEPKNPAYAWAVHHHPDYGRTVLLIRDGDQGDLHHYWKYDHDGFLHRSGGYWWNGKRWYRPSQVWDSAFEHYDLRPVDEPTTVTAADLLSSSGKPENGRVEKIASFTGAGNPLPGWEDHLALWAQLRASQPGARPLEDCVVDLRTPELERAKLIGRTGLAEAAGISVEDLPDPRYGRGDLPVPQHENAEDGMWWSVPVAQDWAEHYRRKNGPEALLSASTVYGSTQPVGLVADHDRLRRMFHDDLTSRRQKGKKPLRPYMEGESAQEAADALAWGAAASFMYGHDQGFVPHGILRDVLVAAILRSLMEDVEDGVGYGKKVEDLFLGDLPLSTVKLLSWYIQRQPGSTAGIFGEVCLSARTRLGLRPLQVGRLLRRSLRFDSSLDVEMIDALLAMTLPPSAKDPNRQ
ncbi:hypothetical protein [Streptomyces sp. NBC_01237]|uniref:hypothetical protein n=1 Tax=Streptomyces sp. NBC_01237 TaxID=2903790 RepID=UPI002DD88B36|nr:hypothetical protein [Streptomyces sp. NBC_01237]WRZ76489.1 hypothetical protein OG251_35460 [Streptomyces sp. NBC_01237]